MYRTLSMFRRILFLFLPFLAIASHAAAQGTAPAIYHAASGDPAGKCLYVIFTFSEQSCFSCLSEINGVWCPAMQYLKEPEKVGMVVLFNSPRLEIAGKMRERMRDAGCQIPFVVDTNGAYSEMLFQSDAAGQVLLADANGEVLIHRNIGEEDDFSNRLHFGGGPGGLVYHIDSLTGRCTEPSRVIGTQMGSQILPAQTPASASMLRVLDSVIMEGADTVEMPFGFTYSPSERRYAFMGGANHTIYLHDSSGRRRSEIHVSRTMNPTSIAFGGGYLYAVGGEADTMLFTGAGKDSVLVPDELITLLRCDMSGRTLGRYRMNALSPLSIANDVSLGARKLYLTTQRSATSSYIYKRGIPYEQYLNELYDPKTYGTYIDTMKIIREYDTAVRLQRTYGSLPQELASYGASRTHFWLEFQRWVRELPDGSVALLHCASPALRIYRDGALHRTIDLRGDYYQPITGQESDGKIPRYAGMIVGEDGRIYCEYQDAIRRKQYVVVVDPKTGTRGQVAEIGRNDNLLRVDSEGRLHLVRKGRHIQLVVCAPVTQGG